MGLANRIAILGHRGWAARRIIQAFADHPYDQPLRILAREGSDVSALPSNVEIFKYTWEDQASIRHALQGIDVLISFVGPEGLKDQAKLIEPMKQASVKLFVPSDLALPYTAEERTNVQIPREKYELELQLKDEGMPFLVICIGNFTSFALDSPYMGIDLPNHRIVHYGSSRQNSIWLCSLEYVAAGFVSIFSHSQPSELAGKGLIGLNELRPTTLQIEQAMADISGRPPQVADGTVEDMAKQAEAGRLDALVRKKMGDGTHTAVRDKSELYEFDHPKLTLLELIRRSPIDDPPYIPQTEDTVHFLDNHFK